MEPDMGTESTAAIIAYLRSLAPAFFMERMRGSSEADILRLERVAGLRMSDGHREFLRAMGATPARVLNPFLNDRDFCVSTLVEEYEELRRERVCLPPGVVYFSSSAITGSNIFLRHGELPGDDPEIGDLSPQTGEFVVFDERHFESFLRRYSFHFRMFQLDHELHVRPPWNADEERWEGERDRCSELLQNRGFELVFTIDDGTECREQDGIAVALYHDGSMTMAGDDLEELQRRARNLAAETRLIIESVPNQSRLRAPRA